MSVVKKFNGLNGAVLTRKEIEKMLIQAREQEQPELVQRLQAVLKKHPKEKDFKFNIKAPATESIPESVLPGFQLDEINEESGLAGVSQNEIYSMVTDMILNTIKQVGHLPWQKEWTGTGGHSASNYVTKKPYRGINFILNFETAFDNEGNPYLVPINFDQPYYLTFNQIEAAGAKLVKGSKARKVFYYSMIYKFDNGKLKISTSDRDIFNAFVKENGITPGGLKEYSFKIPVVKYYNVYRADHCTGLKFPDKPIRPIIEPIEICQAIIDNYPNPPKYTFGGDDAVYYPTADTVNMPHIEDFTEPAFYYSTYFHEIIHSTGHRTRLDRGLGRKPSPRDYAFEELIAELGAVYLCSEAGILFSTKDNSAKYLRGWNSRLVGAMQEDNKFFFKAAAAAQKATDHILDLDADDVPAYVIKSIGEGVKAFFEKRSKKKASKKDIIKALESSFDIVEELVYPKGTKRAGMSEFTAKYKDFVLSIKPGNVGYDVFLGKPGKDVGNVSTFNEIESWFPSTDEGLIKTIEAAIKIIISESGKQGSKTVAKKVATTTTKKSNVIGYAIVDNIGGNIVASKTTLTELEKAYHSLGINKDFQDMPVLVYEIVKSGTKNKLGNAVKVDWKTEAESFVTLPKPVAKRKRKQDPQQLTLGLNGKRKAKKEGLNGLVVRELEQPAPVEPAQVEHVPVEQCPLPDTTAAPVRPGSLAERKRDRANKVVEYYTIDNLEIARFLGNVEKKVKESVAITLTGGQGSMKTRMLFQCMNTFGHNYKIGHASIEEHPESTVYFDKVDEYLDEVSVENITAPEITKFEDLHKLIIENDVICIDSFQKLQEMFKGFELDKDLRKKYNGKLFIVIFQQTSDGSMRGGTKSQFDADIVLFTEKCPDYRDNYVYPDKNRYNSIPADQLKFNIFTGKMIKHDSELQPELEPVPAGLQPGKLKFEVI